MGWDDLWVRYFLSAPLTLRSVSWPKYARDPSRSSRPCRLAQHHPLRGHTSEVTAGLTVSTKDGKHTLCFPSVADANQGHSNGVSLTTFSSRQCILRRMIWKSCRLQTVLSLVNSMELCTQNRLFKFWSNSDRSESSTESGNVLQEALIGTWSGYCESESWLCNLRASQAYASEAWPHRDHW